MMNQENNQSRLVKLGWGILIASSVLLLFNGMMWFFFGPQQVVKSIEEFGQANPEIERQMATNARQVAIWYLAFGSLALLVTLDGFRNNRRWAWYGTWVLVAAMAAVGLLYRNGFGIWLLGLAIIALTGQFLAWRGLSPSSGDGTRGIEGYAK